MARLILFNKPFHCLSQFRDSSGRTTLAHFFDDPTLRVAGRLDYDSEGLLLLTDDGQMAHQITAPRHKMQKTYWVQVEGDADESALARLRSGVVLNDGPARARAATRITPPQLWARDPPVRQRKTISDHWLEIVITEGRNRQVRRMTAAVGLPTLRLVRAAVGDWQLDDLLPGQSRELRVHTRQTSNPAVRRKSGSRR